MARPLTIEEIRKDAERRDVTHHLLRCFGYSKLSRDQNLLSIQRRGFESETILWLKSMTSEGMKYGTASKSQRLEKAKYFAKRAGVDLSVLAEKTGLKHTLGGA